MNFSKTNKAQVWSCGGGTQSCAIAALIVQGKIQKPDIAVIADTGYEKQSTWNYCDKVLIPELSNVGVDLVRIYAKEFSPCGTNFANSKGTVLMPCFTTENGNGKLSAYCSSYWKRDTISKWLLSKHGISKSMAVKWIGFSADEQRRVLSMMKTPEYQKGLIRFPLVELNLKRRDSIQVVENFGWPTPPRSSCWMCPNMADSEWRALSKEEFSKAVELQKEIQKHDPCAWLHKSCLPLDQVDFSQPDDLFTRPCDSGQCFV